MDAAATIVQGLVSAEASVEIYDAVASVSTVGKLAAAARNKLHVTRIAMSLRRANRSLKSLLDLVDDVQSGKRLMKEASEPVSLQQIQNTIENLDHICRTIDFLYESMRRVGLTNNSLVAGALNSFKAYSEPLKDLVDWLDVLSKPEYFKSVFDRAKLERERGELVDLAEIE
jgi:hypothetical protein